VQKPVASDVVEEVTMIRTLVLMAVATIAVVSGSAQWKQQQSGTKSSFRGLSVVDARVAWIGGTGGTFGRTTDGGLTWRTGVVPGAEELDFRDVQAFGPSTAYLMSAGEGSKSRVYKTTDGGATWSLLYSLGADGFFDAIAFWDELHGVVMSDPVGGRFLILTTSDGGKSWSPVARDAMPPALPNEGGFAASGTCLIVRGRSTAWFATGGASVSRVFRSDDRGRTWTVAPTPIAAGSPGAGIFSLAFLDERHGVAVGGDYKNPTSGSAARRRGRRRLQEPDVWFGERRRDERRRAYVDGASGSRSARLSLLR
jgi:photosystem II stability/assembly factor-like uncharacterized protein